MKRIFFPVSIRWVGYLVVVLSIIAATGCADLAAVRSFAKTSAATADFRQVPADYVASAVRRESFKPDDANFSTHVPADRAEEFKRFEAAQTVLVAYMNALGDLAADELPSVDSEVKGLVAELNKAEFITATDEKAKEKTLTAAGTILSSLTKMVLTAKRNSELKRLILANNESVQTVVAGLADVVSKDFVDSLEKEEKDEANSYFRKIEDGAKDRVLAKFLVRSARIEYASANEARIKKAKAYAQMLLAIGKGHAQLSANAANLKGDGLKNAIKQYTDEIQKLYKAMKDLS